MYRNRAPNTVRPVSSENSDITPEQNDAMPPLVKIPDLQFDIEQLQFCMREYVLTQPIFWAGGATEKRPKRKYGGWSLTSSTGDMHDGWQSVAGWVEVNGVPVFDLRIAYENGFMPRWFHTKRTQICQGYFNEVLDKLTELGFVPHAARIWSNPPGGHHIGPHTDGPDNSYAVRLHIPLITNDGCVHEWYLAGGDYKVHIPADGSAYLFRTNLMHDTYNHGTEDRYHLIIEVYDTKGVVPGFKYDHIARLDSRFRAEVKKYTGRDV